MHRTEISIPGSTSNLGASFDTCGLALKLYLRVTVEQSSSGFRVTPSGEGALSMPHNEANLIFRVALEVAKDRGHVFKGACLTVENDIPLARGLGSSSCAIIAGISVYEELSGEQLNQDKFFKYALRFEDHGDNLAPGLLGGLTVACAVTKEGGAKSLIAVKRPWPEHIKAVLAIPEFEMKTKKMRSILPREVSREHAIFNIQRAALLQAAISEARYDLLSEALRDKLHQPHRAPLAPGLKAVLRLNSEAHKHPGLLGVALSGAGSTLIAFATENFEGIARLMRERLEASNVKARTLTLGIDNVGRTLRRFEAS
jgi:homoserine kinase